VNGVQKKILPQTSITGLLTQLNIIPHQVAVEQNLLVIDKNKFDQVLLEDGDNIEIINFVGGGSGRRLRLYSPVGAVKTKNLRNGNTESCGAVKSKRANDR